MSELGRFRAFKKPTGEGFEVLLDGREVNVAVEVSVTDVSFRVGCHPANRRGIERPEAYSERSGSMREDRCCVSHHRTDANLTEGSLIP